MLFDDLKKLFGLPVHDAGMNKKEIEKFLIEGEKDKRKRIIEDQINLYSKSLFNEIEITASNAVPLLFKNIQDTFNTWYYRYDKDGNPVHEQNNPISQIMLEVPRSQLQQFIDGIKNTITAY